MYYDKVYQQVLKERFDRVRNGTRTYPADIDYLVEDGYVEKVVWVTAHSFVKDLLYPHDTDLINQLAEWCTSEKGQWILSRALSTPTWYDEEISAWVIHQRCVIRARLAGAALTEWTLKYGANT